MPSVPPKTSVSMAIFQEMAKANRMPWNRKGATAGMIRCRARVHRSIRYARDMSRTSLSIASTPSATLSAM